MQYLFHHMLLDSAARNADREALVDAKQRLGFGTMADQVAALATGMRALGVQRGERVAIFLKPSVSLPLSIFGVSMAGGVFVPVHHGLFPDQVAHILKDSGAIGLITDSQRFELLQEVLPQASKLKFAIVDGGTQDTPIDSTSHVSQHAFETICLGQLAACPEVGIGKDLAAILYTSGSTGRPKGVMLSHANLLAGAKIVASYLSINQDDRLLAALPLSFDAGLNQLTTAVLKSGTTVMLDFRFGRDIVQQLVNERITGLAGVPSLWSLLSQPSSGLGKHSMARLRFITNTGGALPQSILKQLREWLPDTEIYLMYGLTEAFRSTYLPPSELDRRPTSMGKAMPDTEIMVLNDQGDLCEPGEVGELVHHGPTVSMGYWGHPELTQQVLRPHPFPQPGGPTTDFVCYSGDLVNRDEDGFLYFVGRRDNQIKSSGFRISATEVEDVICKVAPIRHAAVVGVPDPILGQHLVAFAIPQEKSGPLEPVEILARCANEMPRYMVPRQLRLVNSLPMTSSGKVDYPKLRDELANEKQTVLNAASAAKNDVP